MQNFKELFVYYDNVLTFHCFFKIHKKRLVENIQDRTELMFDMDEIILNRTVTTGQNHSRFLRLRMWYKELLDKLAEVFHRSR